AGTGGRGLGALVGVIRGLAGGLSLHAVRQLNTRAVRRAAAALAGGDARRLERLHAASIVRDAGRAAVVTALGLVLAQVARAYLAGALPPHGVALLNVAAVGAALAAGTAGTLRLVGRGPGLRWFAARRAGRAMGAGLVSARRRARSTTVYRRSRWSACARRCAGRSARSATGSCGRGGCRSPRRSPSSGWRSVSGSRPSWASSSSTTSVTWRCAGGPCGP